MTYPNKFFLPQCVLQCSLPSIAPVLTCCFFLIWAAQIGNMQTELKKLAELNPELKDAYLAKQRRLKVSKTNEEINSKQKKKTAESVKVYIISSLKYNQCSLKYLLSSVQVI